MSVNDWVRWRREQRKAGISPKMRPAARATAAVKSSTGTPTATSARRGTSAGARRSSSGVASFAAATPVTPAASARTAASVTSWRTTRARDAPRAVRMASSDCRAVARAKKHVAAERETQQEGREPRRPCRVALHDAGLASTPSSPRQRV